MDDSRKAVKYIYRNFYFARLMEIEINYDRERGLMLTYKERYSNVLETWHKFRSDIPIDHSTHIDKTIINSWKRSREFGIDPNMRKIPEGIKGGPLDNLLKQNRDLIATSIPFMENLYGHVRGSVFSVVLFDREGYIIHMIGDEDLMTKHVRDNYVIGTCWAESNVGTNGCGTALAENKPVQIFASEHFCRLAHRFTCSGAPIHDNEGTIIGLIDMTGPYERVHPHTLGMVVAASYAIENQLKLKNAMGELMKAYCYQQTIFDSSEEAQFVIDKGETITLINRKAKDLLKLNEETVGERLIDVFPEIENRPLINMITNNTTVIDKECVIYRGNDYNKFMVTATPIRSTQNETLGAIITLNEIKRARRMVTNMIGAKADFEFDKIIGEDPRFLVSIELGKRAALSASNVLLLGGSGTGKDIFAQAIHNGSERKSGPYIAINCGAIPRELITSELFGYSEGAFTGSKKGGNPGKFELADGGTIFLDEIGEMPLELQIALLRVIEERKVTRIGAKRTTPIDVRLIAATNKNLRDEVSKGNFREDLYYRLNVLTIEMIPLKAKINDLPLLVSHFINSLNASLNLSIEGADKKAIDILMNYSWPGNARELQNVVERMMNVASGRTLTHDLIPRDILYTTRPTAHNYENVSLEDMERQKIFELLQANLTKDEIAKQLKIARSTLYLKIKKYGIS